MNFKSQQVKLDTFKDRIFYYTTLINEKLDQVVDKDVPASFYSPVRYILDGGGKRIRPILVILACKSLGGEVHKCLNSAVAIELLHNFTLVHDDIMDQDDLRRERETVHKKWDEATAILVGDGLVALAYHYLLKTDSDKIREISEIFTNGIIELCEGQAFDKEFEKELDIDLAQYISMIEKKTALLLMISLEIGAIVAGGNQAQRQLFKDFAKELGCAFQIQDDLLDIKATSGKTFGSDIQQKKKTFLFVHAINNASLTDKNRIKSIYQQKEISKDDILEVRDIFYSTGTMEYATQEVKERIDKARASLTQLPPSESSDDIKLLLNMILSRKS
jgi:geranylgeranyl diphosphate synthase, type II